MATFLDYPAVNCVKALGIVGSPREGGNTEDLMRIALETLTDEGIETELITLSDKDILPCTACGVCGELKDGTCALEGDDFAMIFQKMLDADAIIIGSPVYFGSATAQVMALLQRAGYVSRQSGNLVAGKCGGAIVVARRAGQNFTLAQILYWFYINGMIVPGSSYWNIAFGLEKGTAATDEEGCATIRTFAKNLAFLMKKLYSS